MIHFVGAGPGAVDLITLRGARLLRRADVVVYAGSLVNPELLALCGEGCVVYDSSGMTLGQIVDVLVDAHERGLSCVRLHTGDPALYGAHGEQMEALDARGVPYDVVPGVSSLFGAAAALKAELTVPEVSQTLIVSRAAGRTPVPDAERLRLLATHDCTLALFLSAGLLDEVQAELVAGGYAPTTPAAIVVRATWPDEAVWHCTVRTLAQCAREHGVTRTALVFVGRFLDTRGHASHLYDATFSHGYRLADVDDGAPYVPAANKKDEYPRTQRRMRLIGFTARGVALAKDLAASLAADATVHAPARLAAATGVKAAGELGTWVGLAFRDADALVFVGACGIAVRLVAPHVRDKTSDPAVVVVDESGRFAIPVLSGHMGGANELAREVAAICGATPVVTTATDVNGLFAVDEWASSQGLVVIEREEAKRVSATLLEGKSVGIASEFELRGSLPKGVVDSWDDAPAVGIALGWGKAALPFAHTLHLVPRGVTVGIGCKRGTDARALLSFVRACLDRAGVAPEAVCTLASIDIKRDEPAIHACAREGGWAVRFHTASELAALPGEFSNSAFVERMVGVGNVCERAACACGEKLLMHRTVGEGITVALAATPPVLVFDSGLGTCEHLLTMGGGEML